MRAAALCRSTTLTSPHLTSFCSRPFWESMLRNHEMLPPPGVEAADWLKRAGLKKAWQTEYIRHLEERNRSMEVELLVALSSNAAKDEEIEKLKSRVCLTEIEPQLSSTQIQNYDCGPRLSVWLLRIWPTAPLLTSPSFLRAGLKAAKLAGRHRGAHRGVHQLHAHLEAGRTREEARG